MKTLGARTAAVLVILVCLVGGAGCNARVPLGLDADFASAGVDKILLLPVIDARPERLDYVVISRNVADATVRIMGEKGYLVSESDAYGQRPTGPIDIDTVEAKGLAALAPEDARCFLVVQVERMDRSVDELGASYSVRLSALLVDRDAVRVLWRDTASASNNLTGMLTVLAHGSSQYEAAVNATRTLFETLPLHPDVEKIKKKH